MKDKEKTDLILSKLHSYFSSWGRERSNIIFPELRLGSGYCGVAQRRIDFFVINSGAGNTTTAFEIKVSRADFKKDIENDLKQRGARLYSNYFYYVTPKGLLQPEEIPIWAGLWEYDFDTVDSKHVSFIERVPAPLHSKAMPSWGLICSLIRKLDHDCRLERLREEHSLEIQSLKLKLDECRKLNDKYAITIMKNKLEVIDD